MGLRHWSHEVRRHADGPRRLRSWWVSQWPVLTAPLALASYTALTADAQSEQPATEPPSFVAVSPSRIRDTRNGTGTVAQGELGANRTLDLHVAGRTLDIAATVPADAAAGRAERHADRCHRAWRRRPGALRGSRTCQRGWRRSPLAPEDTGPHAGERGTTPSRPNASPGHSSSGSRQWILELMRR